MLRKLSEALLLSLCCLSAALAHDKLSIEDVPQAISQNQIEINPLYAKNRTKIAKSYLANNPNLTMTTKVTGLFEKIYQKDLAFIQQEINKRPNAKLIRDQLNNFDQHVVQLYFKDQMSFADFNFIGLAWTKILSEEAFSLASSLAEYECALDFHSKKIRFPAQDYVLRDYRFIQTPTIVIPHVSKTGTVPIRTINKGYGSWINENQVYGFDYLGIGTNPLLNYDEMRNRSSYSAWKHDWDHIATTGNANQDFMFEGIKKRIIKRANMRKEIETQLNHDTLDRKQVELAFFEIFHETISLRGISCLEDALLKKIDTVKNTLTKDLPKEEDDLFFYESQVEILKHLELPVRGKTLLEQEKCFLNHLLDGLEKLKPFPQYYDGDNLPA